MSSPRSQGFVSLPTPITGVATIPAAVSQSGTLTADSNDARKLLSDESGGDPTCDFSGVKLGDYILIGSDMRKVRYNHAGNDNNQRIDMVSAFGTPPSGSDWSLVQNKLYNKVVLLNSGGAPCTINGVTYPSSDFPIVFESDQGLEALLIDGTGTTVNVIETY